MDDELWTRVAAHWRSAGTEPLPGVDDAAIEQWEARHDVRLPADLRAYFRAAGGTREMDDAFFRFWSLAELRPAADYVGAAEAGPLPNCFAFADHCIDCWGYAVEIRADGTTGPVYCTFGGDGVAGPPHAASFRDFFERYLADPSSVI
ncbi:MAG TPA: SMI1/KNR4 family protein [Tepidisphaeraceae bacterium]|nr:SMI1/KNR4 family protein [Tepidisphaeraceae bacterium]